MSATGEITEDRPVGTVLAWSRELVGPALRQTVERLPESVRAVAGYHFGWYDEQGRPTDADHGKAIRPTLALLAAEAVGGLAVDAVGAAVAVELVHNFSLLHDDVMDRDTTRRHRPTAWTVFGTGPAILAGDALLMAAFDTLATSLSPAAGDATAFRDRAQTLSAAVLALVDGQAVDLAFEDRDDVDLVECLAMAGHKTGALLGCAAGLGAASGGGDPDQIQRLRRFGEELGLAFQLSDDLLGIWGDPAVTGKPVHSDLRNRKKSLPVVAAVTSGTPAGRELAELYLGQQPLTNPELERAAQLVETAGGRAWAQQEADQRLALALDQLRAVDPVERAATELAALAGLAARRDH